VCCHSSDQKFSALGNPNRVWAISSIHGDINKLIQLHDALFEKINPGDRVVYTGNYTGYGEYSRETIDEILIFRRLLLAQPGMKPDDIVYLRGTQEDMWHQLSQLHFDHHPVDSLLDMMGKGLSATMQSYGISPHDGIMAAREGISFLTRWTNEVRYKIRQNPGHEMFMTQSRRAAFTNVQDRFPLLFVSSGIDTHKPLNEQKDTFWSIESNFEHIHAPYDPFEKVIRGFDPQHKGIHLNCVTATLDGGCGFGGSLVGAHMSADGEFHELLEA
jgi:hypothetical protein